MVLPKQVGRSGLIHRHQCGWERIVQALGELGTRVVTTSTLAQGTIAIGAQGGCVQGATIACPGECRG